jgi:hypothetical protein
MGLDRIIRNAFIAAALIVPVSSYAVPKPRPAPGPHYHFFNKDKLGYAEIAKQFDVPEKLLREYNSSLEDYVSIPLVEEIEAETPAKTASKAVRNAVKSKDNKDDLKLPLPFVPSTQGTTVRKNNGKRNDLGLTAEEREDMKQWNKAAREKPTGDIVETDRRYPFDRVPRWMARNPPGTRVPSYGGLTPSPSMKPMGEYSLQDVMSDIDFERYVVTFKAFLENPERVNVAGDVKVVCNNPEYISYIIAHVGNKVLGTPNGRTVIQLSTSAPPKSRVEELFSVHYKGTLHVYAAGRTIFEPDTLKFPPKEYLTDVIEKVATIADADGRQNAVDYIHRFECMDKKDHANPKFVLSGLMQLHLIDQSVYVNSAAALRKISDFIGSRSFFGGKSIYVYFPEKHTGDLVGTINISTPGGPHKVSLYCDW